MKSMNMGIWEIGVSNQLFIRDSYTEIKFIDVICTQEHQP